MADGLTDEVHEQVLTLLQHTAEVLVKAGQPNAVVRVRASEVLALVAAARREESSRLRARDEGIKSVGLRQQIDALKQERDDLLARLEAAQIAERINAKSFGAACKRAEASEARLAEAESAMQRIQAHTVPASDRVVHLRGLLDSVRRIADAFLARRGGETDPQEETE